MRQGRDWPAELLRASVEEFAAICASALRDLPESSRDRVFTEAFNEALAGEASATREEMLSLVLGVLRAAQFPELMYLGART